MIGGVNSAALDGTFVEFPGVPATALLEFFNRMLDVKLGQGAGEGE